MRRLSRLTSILGLIVFAFVQIAHAMSISELDAQIAAIDFSKNADVAGVHQLHLLSERLYDPNTSIGEARRLGMGLAIEYLHAHYLQDAIWTLQQIGAVHSTDLLREKIKKFFVEHEPLSRTKLSRNTYTYKYPGNITAVFKKEGEKDNPKAETWVYELSEALELHLVPLTFEYADGDLAGSLQLFVQNTERGENDFKVFQYTREFADLFALDYISLNKDRTYRNWLRREGNKRRKIAIDNGLSYDANNPEWISYDLPKGMLDTPASIMKGTPALQKLRSISDGDLMTRLEGKMPEDTIEHYVQKRDELLWRLGLSVTDIRTTQRFRFAMEHGIPRTCRALFDKASGE